MRPSLRLLSIPAALCTLGLCASCGGGVSAGGLSGKTADQVIVLTQAAIAQEGSFHFIDVSGSGNKSQRLTGDASNGDGQQTLVDPDGGLYVRRVGSVIYLKGSEIVLEQSLKFTASEAKSNAGKWIEITSKESPYQTVAKALLPSSEITPYIPVNSLTVGSPKELGGHDVVPVTGSAPSTDGASATATIYVSTASPYVPVGATLTGTGTTKNDTEEATFNEWGEGVTTTTPSPVVSYSSITSAS